MKETNFTFSSSTSTMAQEMGGAGDAIDRSRSSPPAFLTKTYQIIGDPTSNSIASWGKYGDSFIIWDHIKFSAEILPKYFRHNNFASFIYQLNNYGFRKIGVEHQWEYCNPYFQKQKPHLLSNMKRRSEQTPRRHRNNVFCPEKMKEAIDESKLEIEKLKMQQLDIDFHITALEQESKSISANTQKMVATWAEACGIIAKRRRETAGNQKADDEDDDEPAGKRKKAADCEEVSDKNGGRDFQVDEMVKELSTPLSEIESMNCGGDGEGKLMSDICSNYLDLCKVIMLDDDDDEVFGVGGGDHSKQAEISKDFQDLIMMD